MNKTTSPREQALAWWQEQIEAGRHIVRSAETPGGAVNRALREEGYAAEAAGGRVWILKTPDREDLRTLCLANYWAIVRSVLQDYAPAVVERASAVRIYLGDATPPRQLTVRQAANRSKYTIEICQGLSLHLAPGPVDPQGARSFEVGETEIRVDPPEVTLLGLPLNVLRKHLDDVAVWLKSLIVSRPALEAAYAERPRPVVVKRLAHMARDIGNERLAEQLNRLVALEYEHPIGRGHTGVGSKIVVPDYVAQLRSGAPWLDRHAAGFERLRGQVEALVEGAEKRLARFEPAVLIEQARQAKTYDAYHSTTIEGYRITPQEVSALIRNESVGGNDPEDIRSRMAIAGYSAAFDRCLRTLQETDGRVTIDTALIRELHMELFAPSLDAGIVAADDLRGWRCTPAFLHGHLHVPPSPDKVPQLMQQFESLVNTIETRPVVRAVMAHWDFVTIHPFPDGNGRLARFLMNLALVGERLPWITIRADERPTYFGALETAQVGDDAGPFSRFLVGHLERAVVALV